MSELNPPSQNSPGALPERARTAIQDQECVVDGKRVMVTISAGVVAWSEGGNSDALLRVVDRALYRAKQSGRNRVVLADTAQPEVEDVVA